MRPGHLNLNGHRIVRNASRNSCVAVSWGRGVAVRSRVPSDPRLPVMAIEVAVPGTADLQLQHLLLDVPCYDPGAPSKSRSALADKHEGGGASPPGPQPALTSGNAGPRLRSLWGGARSGSRTLTWLLDLVMSQAVQRTTCWREPLQGPPERSIAVWLWACRLARAVGRDGVPGRHQELAGVARTDPTSRSKQGNRRPSPLVHPSEVTCREPRRVLETIQEAGERFGIVSREARQLSIGPSRCGLRDGRTVWRSRRCMNASAASSPSLL
jgi:hypothetical protein